MKTGPKPLPIEERFWRYVRKSESCWIWTGNKYPTGYGQLGIGSRSDNSRRKIPAHRLSYQIHKGKIPNGLFICHRCNVKECVNPAHLYLGTHTDNMRDASKDGLLRKSDEFRERMKLRPPKPMYGSDNPATKINKETAAEIRSEYSTGNISQQKLAMRFSVSQSLISKIVLNEIWVT